MNRRSLSRAALALGLLCAFAAQSQAQAQDFPTKAVRVFTPFPVGSGPDAWLRVVAEKLQKKWGKPVIVENKPGANGFIAIDAFKRGDTAGYDLIQLDNVHLAAYPHLFKKLPYDPVKDFDVMQPLFRGYFFFAVPTDSKYKTVADIVADAKARPGALNYGSWSVGNPVHLGSALLEATTSRSSTCPGWPLHRPRCRQRSCTCCPRRRRRRSRCETAASAPRSPWPRRRAAS